MNDILQFVKPPTKIPYKAILLAIALLLGGTLLITVGSLLLTGFYIDPKVDIFQNISAYKYTVLP